MKVHANNISMQYKDGDRLVEVLDDVSFEVSSGESLAIIGQSGVGKTTLLNVLSGLEVPTSGDVIIGDYYLSDSLRKKKDVSEFRGSNIGLVFQFYQLLPEFDAVENVSMPLLIQGMDFENAKAKAENILDRVGLADRFTHRPGMLSGGEQQRVAIARALVTKPGLILADEPTGNLDTKTSIEIMSIFEDIHKRGNTIILVTREPDIAEHAHRIIRLRDGLVESDIKNDKIVTVDNPEHRYNQS